MNELGEISCDSAGTAADVEDIRSRLDIWKKVGRAEFGGALTVVRGQSLGIARDMVIHDGPVYRAVWDWIDRFSETLWVCFSIVFQVDLNHEADSRFSVKIGVRLAGSFENVKLLQWQTCTGSCPKYCYSAFVAQTANSFHNHKR